MKTKKLLLALPMVAILAGCSSRLDVYRDIFKDARDLDSDTKAQLIDNLTAYQYTGTRTIITTLDGEEVGRSENEISVEFYHRVETGDIEATYNVDDEPKIRAASADDAMYSKFQEVVFSWKGHILVGNYDVLPYEYNTKLLNCVSAKFSKKTVENKHVKDGNFTFTLSGSASYSDGEITHEVSAFSVTYVDHRITSYLCNYSLILEDDNVRIDKHFQGTYSYS